MVEVVEGLIIFGAVVGFEVLAARFGKSTRDGEDWQVPATVTEHVYLARRCPCCQQWWTPPLLGYALVPPHAARAVGRRLRRRVRAARARLRGRDDRLARAGPLSRPDRGNRSVGAYRRLSRGRGEDQEQVLRHARHPRSARGARGAHGEGRPGRRCVFPTGPSPSARLASQRSERCLG